MTEGPFIPICPDNVFDNMELVEELSEWIDERKEKADPDKMAFLLIFVASEIFHYHAPESLWDRYEYLATVSSQLGKRFVMATLEDEKRENT